MYYKSKMQTEGFTVYIPKNGSPFVSNFVSPQEDTYLEISGSFGLQTNGRIKMLIHGNLGNVLDCVPCDAEIVLSDDLYRSKYTGLDWQDAQRVLSMLNCREHILWDRPPKLGHVANLHELDLDEPDILT
jgi:hypothetical protein